MRLAGARSWRSLPALYRDNAVFVTASAAQGLEQAASGARVIGPLGSGVDPATVRGELEAARAARPLTLAEIRAGLRDIFLASATPARLAALVRAAELPGALVGGRQVGVLVSLADAAQAGRLAAALLGQRLRPAEVIAAAAPAAAGAVRAALGPLAGHGHPGRGDRRRGARRRPARGRRGLGAAPGPAGQRPLARAVGRRRRADGGLPARPGLRAGVRAGGRGRPASGHGAVEYEFTRWLDEPALVRAHLLDPGGPAAGDWGSHGLRLFTIAADRVP